MTGYRLSPRAQADLEDIWDNPVGHWGGRRAEAYMRQIDGAVEAPAAVSGLARRCDEMRPGYWKHPVGSHVIFFRRHPYGIDVMRVLQAG